MKTLILIGIISGIITGITGLQIGILIPALMFFNIIPDLQTAIGTTLYAFLPPTSILAVYYLYKKKHVDVKKGNILIIVLLFSCLLGSFISTFLSKQLISLIYAIILLGLSIYYFIFYFKNRRYLLE
jgi:uncharacterized membrane protein YfcA